MKYTWLVGEEDIVFFGMLYIFLMGVLVNKCSRGRWGKRFKSTGGMGEGGCT